MNYKDNILCSYSMCIKYQRHCTVFSRTHCGCLKAQFATAFHMLRVGTELLPVTLLQLCLQLLQPHLAGQEYLSCQGWAGGASKFAQGIECAVNDRCESY